MKSATANYLSVPPAGAPDNSPVNLKRSGSERLRDGAKNILRRVESIKSRRKKKKNREGVVISGPMPLDIMQLHQRFNHLTTKDIKATRSNTTSPLPMSPVGNPSTPLFLFADQKVCPATETHAAMFGTHLSPYTAPRGHPASRTSPLHFFAKPADDSSSYCSEVSQDSSNGSAEKKLSPVGRYFQSKTKQRGDEAETLSDSEAFNSSRHKKKSHKAQKTNALVRGGGGSLNLGRDSSKYRDSLKTKRIFRSRSAVRHTSDADKSQDVAVRAKSGAVVQRWHSFRAQTNTKRDFADGEGVSLCKLSCGQIEKLRKLALVTLTGYMERFVRLT
jgi:deleted in liver cancer protein